MGISITGLLVAAFIFIPNLLFVIFPPKNVPNELNDDVGIIFNVLERIGQVGCLLILGISKDNYENVSIDLWLILMILCIIAYYILWVRYIVRGQVFSLLFKPLVFLPIPMAIFPVFAFVFAALWGNSIYLGILVALLAVGHFVNSWHTYKLTVNSPESPRF